MALHFDFIVIGKGLVGSATAKYLARSGHTVALIGPDEPEVLSLGEAFASHYDSSRVQRQMGRNMATTALNRLALNEYPQLQKDSGIRFHNPAGCLYVNSTGMDAYLETYRANDASAGNCTFFESSIELSETFPYFRFSEGSSGMLEASPSGFINPRDLIKAQLRVVEKHSGIFIRKIVKSISHASQMVHIMTADSEIYACGKVIIATGAFTNLFPLLKYKLALTLKSETILLARLENNVHDLYAMPALLYEVDTFDYEGIYLTPPTKYPNGRTYLKMGCNLANDIYFDDNIKDVQAWFRGQDHRRNLRILKQVLRTILPGLSWINTQSKPCILTRTAGHGNPYIDILDDRLIVAIGNGYSAMCSDGIGYVAAQLAVQGCYPPGFEGKDYQLHLS